MLALYIDISEQRQKSQIKEKIGWEVLHRQYSEFGSTVVVSNFMGIFFFVKAPIIFCIEMDGYEVNCP